MLIYVPAGWSGSSLGVACPRELGHLRFAPSVRTWKEVNKGAPSQPFALRRSSQLARNIKDDAPPCRNTVNECSESGRRIIEWLKLCYPNRLVHTVGSQRKQLGFVLCVKLRELGQNSSLSNVSRSLFIHIQHLKRVKVHWMHIKICLGIKLN